MREPDSARNLDILLLELLADGPHHGHAILTRIDPRDRHLLGDREGDIYPRLHRLELWGLIEARWADAGKARQGRFYRLTRRGRRRLADRSLSMAPVPGSI